MQWTQWTGQMVDRWVVEDIATCLGGECREVKHQTLLNALQAPTM